MMESNTQVEAVDATTQQPAGQRRRIQLTEEAMDTAIVMANKNKVSQKNAWDVKLLEGMEGSVQQWMGEGEETDQYKQFHKAATLVEGGAKVWTYRVENIHSLSNQMLQRLLRNDTRVRPEDDAEGEGDSLHLQRRKKKTLERTVALSKVEIDLEEKQQCSAGSEAVSAMFRAMTEKFDQSHAQGLLLNNCPMGAAGNIILDRNLAKNDGPELDVEQQEEEMPDIPFARSSQQIKDSPTMKIPYARPDDLNSTFGGGNTTRASSVAGDDLDRSDDMSDNGDLGDFGGDGFDDYGGDGEDEDMQPGGDLSRAGSVARRLVTGHDDFEEMDKLALVAENDEWVPLTDTAASSQGVGAMGRTAAGGGMPQSQMLTSIKKSCKLAKIGSGNPDTASQVGQKRTRSGKTVSFAAASQEVATAAAGGATTAGGSYTGDGVDVNEPFSLMENIKMAKNLNTSVLPFSKELLSRSKPMESYLKESHCDQVAREQPSRAPLVFRNQLDVLGSKRNGAAKSSSSTYGGHLTGAQTLLGNAPPEGTNFFQPFSTSKPHWNILKKMARHAHLETTNITRFHQDAAGNYEAVDEEFDVMPNDIFDGGMGDDGPDGDDYDEPPMFNLAAEELGDMPDVDGEGGAGESDIKLIDGPEVVKALKMSKATIPTLVNVGELRRCMWNSTRLLVPPPKEEGDEDDASLKEEDEENENPDRVFIDPNAQNTFCSVVADTLPQINKFSKDGTLSPAFFFFSLLFLANEHGLELKSSADDSLKDIQIKRAVK